jgi:hypothetical protein
VSYPERWWVNGWELTGGVFRDVEIRDGLYNSPPPSTQAQDVYVVGRHGVLDALRRTADAGSFVLQMWALEATWAQAAADYHLLLRAAGQYAYAALWQHQLPDGATVRQTYGRMSAAVEPSSLGQQGWRAAIEIQVPSAFWQDSAISTDTTAGGSLVLPLASKALVSAPMNDLTYTITGPITNPQVMVTTPGDPFNDWFQLAGTIPAGDSVTFNAGTWAITAAGIVAPTLDVVQWSGDNLLEVMAAPPGLVPTVTLSGSGTTGATKLAVAGYGKYAAAA